MLRIFKRFLPREPLPPRIHFHLDHDGNEVWCDESACRPPRRVEPFILPRH